MDVNTDSTPASTDAEATAIQSIPPNTVAVPIVATAVCATVFNALIPAAFSHFFVFKLIIVCYSSLFWFFRHCQKSIVKFRSDIIAA